MSILGFLSILLCILFLAQVSRSTKGMICHRAAVQDEQMSIYYAFVVSIVAYFGSSCCLLWVYPSGYVARQQDWMGIPSNLVNVKTKM